MKYDPIMNSIPKYSPINLMLDTFDYAKRSIEEQSDASTLKGDEKK